jgi:uncharacterized damage-inducible protein DinB
MTQVIGVAGARTLFQHMEWADSTVWGAALTADCMDEEVRRLLLHVHVVQRAFLHVWTGRPVAEAFKSAEDFRSLAALRDWAMPYYGEAHAYLATVDEALLSTRVELPWSQELTTHLGRVPEATSLADTLFQVTSHSTYHRGQVNSRLRLLGIEPPLVDYIAWAWLGRPPRGVVRGQGA